MPPKASCGPIIHPRNDTTTPRKPIRASSGNGRAAGPGTGQYADAAFARDVLPADPGARSAPPGGVAGLLLVGARPADGRRGRHGALAAGPLRPRAGPVWAGPAPLPGARRRRGPLRVPHPRVAGAPRG